MRPAGGITITTQRRAGEREYQMAFEGVIPSLQRRFQETDSESMREDIERYMWNRACPECTGLRLKPESLAVTIVGRPISETTSLSVSQAMDFFDALEHGDVTDIEGARGVPNEEAWEDERRLVLTDREHTIGRQMLKEIRERLGFLMDVGLDYLTLDRAAMTLSGGEGQRIRLATQIGSGLVGVLYILDEPSIGLHQRDNGGCSARCSGCATSETRCSWSSTTKTPSGTPTIVVDIGPGAGEHGGEIVAVGTVQDLIDEPRSLTGKYLSGEIRVPIPARRRPGNGKVVRIVGAAQNNLKNIDVEIPLGEFVAVTGVSGSGKSTLVNDVLHKALNQAIYRSKERPGRHERIEGGEHLDKVVNIDQAPIGRTPRSNPATYTGAFTPIRELFAAVPDARVRGYGPGRFSFNVKGGRCEACKGEGIIQIEMNFLPDVYVPCETCKGRRYNREALEIRYRGVSIADVLDMTVAEACEVFTNVPTISNKLSTLERCRPGLHPAGSARDDPVRRRSAAGEAGHRAVQARRRGGRSTSSTSRQRACTLPTCSRLLEVLNRLVETGNTVLVIEHNLDVIKTADWVIDLGPEGGERGGVRTRSRERPRRSSRAGPLIRDSTWAGAIEAATPCANGEQEARAREVLV